MSGTFEVDITRDFWISETLITRLLWREVMGPRTFYESPVNPADEPLCPATDLGRGEVDAFVHAYSKLSGIVMQLPSIAQWMIACHGGRPYPAYWAQTEGDLHDEDLASRHVPLIRDSWSVEQKRSKRRIRKVCGFPPNQHGLFDMAGIASHWVRDRFDIPTNEPVPISGSYPAANVLVDDYLHESGLNGVICGTGFKSTIYGYINMTQHFLRPATGLGDNDCSFRLIHH